MRRKPSHAPLNTHVGLDKALAPRGVMTPFHVPEAGFDIHAQKPRKNKRRPAEKLRIEVVAEVDAGPAESILEGDGVFIGGLAVMEQVRQPHFELAAAFKRPDVSRKKPRPLPPVFEFEGGVVFDDEPRRDVRHRNVELKAVKRAQVGRIRKLYRPVFRRQRLGVYEPRRQECGQDAYFAHPKANRADVHTLGFVWRFKSRGPKKIFAKLVGWAALPLMGCATASDGPPPHVMPYDSMAVVLADVHRLEVMMQTHSWHADSARLRGIPIYRGLFQRHGVDPARFRRSWDYYVAHPEHLDSVYRRVVQRLHEQAAPPGEGR